MTNSPGPNVDWDTALLIGRCISGLCWPASNGLIMHYSGIGGPAASVLIVVIENTWAAIHQGSLTEAHPFISLSVNIFIWFLAADTERVGQLADFWAAKNTWGRLDLAGVFPRQQGRWQGELVPGTGFFLGGRGGESLALYICLPQWSVWVRERAEPRTCLGRCSRHGRLTKTDGPEERRSTSSTPSLVKKQLDKSSPQAGD